MKIKIFNLKVKKRFLKIAACLLASTSLMVSVAIPAWADRGKVFREIFGNETGTEPVEMIFPPEKQTVKPNKTPKTEDEFDKGFKKVLKDCQEQITKSIEAKVDSEFNKYGSYNCLKLSEDYKLTKKDYGHIVYGDYENGLHSGGLHLEKGLELLNESFENFKEKMKKFVDEKEKEFKFGSEADKLKSLKKWLRESKNAAAFEIDNNNSTSSMNYYKLNFSNAPYADGRYLFPKNWNVIDLKKALKSAIKSKGDCADLSTVHNILNPINAKQEIRVKLVIAEETNKIKTFYPVNDQASALPQKTVQIPAFDPPVWQKFYPCSINGTQFVFHPFICLNPYGQVPYVQATSGQTSCQKMLKVLILA